MNLKSSIRRVSDSVRKLILTEPTIKARYEQGQSLVSILSSRNWASAWIQQADEALLDVLRRVLNGFAGTPVELDTLMKTQTTVILLELSGAEIRVAVARLRRSGILFGIRKAWGDSFIYLPVDTVAMWQSLLLPIAAKRLTEEEMCGVTLTACSYRLPLSLELFKVWQSIYRHPLLFSSKGTLTRTAINRLTSEMLITPDELECLKLTYPQHEAVPSQVAFSIDLGLCSHVLQRTGNELRIQAQGLRRWLRHSPFEANRQLLELIMNRYGSNDPSLHLIAAAVANLPVNEWFAEQVLIELRDQEKVDQWLRLLEAFGWVERGMIGSQAVFRKNEQLATSQPSELNDRAKILIQPDGEIIVPPETGLAARWMLEEITERVAADHLFVYHLTRRSCEHAYHTGHSLEAVIRFLENHGADGLPEHSRRALQDWFTPLGKVKLAEVMLLRTESSELASTLSEDPLVGKLLLERVGERDYIVDVSSRKELLTRLALLGYPLGDLTARELVNSESAEELDDDEYVHDDEQTGWINRRYTLAMYAPDPTIPSKQELFPGITSIPVSWVMQPRLYHPSTSKDLIQRAMDWQVAIQAEKYGEYCTFTPARIEEEGASWQVVGSMMRTREQIVIRAEEMGEVMIVLPLMTELETI